MILSLVPGSCTWFVYHRHLQEIICIETSINTAIWSKVFVGFGIFFWITLLLLKYIYFYLKTCFPGVFLYPTHLQVIFTVKVEVRKCELRRVELRSVKLRKVEILRVELRRVEIRRVEIRREELRNVKQGGYN